MDRLESGRKAGEKPAGNTPENLLVTGIVRSSHGLDGFVKVESSSGEVEHFAGLGEVLLRTGGPGGTISRIEIEAAEGSVHCLLLKFRGIDTPEQARKLAGSELLVPRDKACPLEKGEYYVCDLCQCVLVYKGETIGTIIGVMEGGAGDLLEVALTEGSVPDSSGKQTRLVPLRDEFIGKIDLKARTVELMHRWILE